MTDITAEHRAAQITYDAAKATYREAKRVYLMAWEDLLLCEALQGEVPSRDNAIGAEK
tara:strand:+ start:233 stop:406 length:174 start_codon:yes stop_codon:yes gene_type:complete